MWKTKVAKIKGDEYMILNLFMEDGEVLKVEYLSSNGRWSQRKSEAKIFFTEADATSALILKRTKWKDEEKKPEPEPDIKRIVQSWSDL